MFFPGVLPCEKGVGLTCFIPARSFTLFFQTQFLYELSLLISVLPRSALRSSIYLSTHHRVQMSISMISGAMLVVSLRILSWRILLGLASNNGNPLETGAGAVP